MAHADRIGSDEPSFVFFETHTAIAPAPDASQLGGESLGLEAAMRSFSGSWGKTIRHRIELSSFESPDYGDQELMFGHFIRYDIAWRGDGVTLRGGLRGITMWSEELRFGTPAVAVAVAPVPRASLELEVESAGLFIASLRRETRRSLRRDLAAQVRGVWPTDRATRGEVRIRARDYTVTPDDDMEVERHHRDVTITAGVGLAMVRRNGIRGMPGFLGVAVRATEGTGAAMFVRRRARLRHLEYVTTAARASRARRQTHSVSFRRAATAARASRARRRRTA
jgi:hypothetical protein